MCVGWSATSHVGIVTVGWRVVNTNIIRNTNYGCLDTEGVRNRYITDIRRVMYASVASIQRG